MVRVKSFKCNYKINNKTCDKKFKKLHALVMHQKWHEKQKQKKKRLFKKRLSIKKKCPTCEKMYSVFHESLHKKCFEKYKANFTKNYLEMFDKYFKFISKRINAYNKELEKENYIGNKHLRKVYIYNFFNKNENKKKIIIIKNKFSNFIKEKTYKHYNINYIIQHNKKEEKELYELLNNMAEEEMYKLKRLNAINLNKYKYHITFRVLSKKNENKNEIEKEIESELGKGIMSELTNKIIDLKDSLKKGEIENIEDLVLELYFHYSPKISLKEIFIKYIHSVPEYNEFDKKYIIRYIKKIKNSYPTDQEIKDCNEDIFENIKEIRRNSTYYEKFDYFFNLLKKFYDNTYNIYRCEFCDKYILNKRIHLTKCKEFINTERFETSDEHKWYFMKHYYNLSVDKMKYFIDCYKNVSLQQFLSYFPSHLKNRITLFKKIEKDSILEKIEKIRKIVKNKNLTKERKKELIRIVRKKRKKYRYKGTNYIINVRKLYKDIRKSLNKTNKKSDKKKIKTNKKKIKNNEPDENKINNNKSDENKINSESSKDILNEKPSCETPENFLIKNIVNEDQIKNKKSNKDFNKEDEILCEKSENESISYKENKNEVDEEEIRNTLYNFRDVFSTKNKKKEIKEIKFILSINQIKK
jgi:hypothetical protein